MDCSDKICVLEPIKEPDDISQPKSDTPSPKVPFADTNDDWYLEDIPVDNRRPLSSIENQVGDGGAGPGINPLNYSHGIPLQRTGGVKKRKNYTPKKRTQTGGRKRSVKRKSFKIQTGGRKRKGKPKKFICHLGARRQRRNIVEINDNCQKSGIDQTMDHLKVFPGSKAASRTNLDLFSIQPTDISVQSSGFIAVDPLSSST